MYHSIKYYRGGVLVSIRFTKVNETNIDDIRKISVKENQTAFIETVDECLKEAEEYAGWCPVGIYNDDILVGFAMYGAFGKNPDAWIDRIIIDRKYQGLGYGRASMEKLIKVVAKQYKVEKIYLSFVEGNETGKTLYESLGFKYTGEKDPNGEFIYQLDLNHKNF